MEVDARRVALDLADDDFPVDLVNSDEVYFVLPFLFPIVGYNIIKPGFPESLPEIPFKNPP